MNKHTLTRDQALKLMQKGGFEAYKSKEHWGEVYAINCERFAPRETEFFEMLYMLMEAAIIHKDRNT